MKRSTPCWSNRTWYDERASWARCATVGSFWCRQEFAQSAPNGALRNVPRRCSCIVNDKKSPESVMCTARSRAEDNQFDVTAMPCSPVEALIECPRIRWQGQHSPTRDHTRRFAHSHRSASVSAGRAQCRTTRTASRAPDNNTRADRTVRSTNRHEHVASASASAQNSRSQHTPAHRPMRTDAGVFPRSWGPRHSLFPRHSRLGVPTT